MTDESYPASVGADPGPSVDVVWLSLHPELVAHCCWDQDMLASLLRNELWPTGLNLVERTSLSDVEDGNGAVVVIPARYHIDDVEQLNVELGRLPWVLVILTSDEESLFPWRALSHPNMRRWIMTPRPELHEGADRFVGEYLPRDTRETLRALGPDGDEGERPLDWFFAGQVTHESRRVLADTLELLTMRGELVRSPSFTAGLERVDYLRTMTAAKVAPAPSGPATPDSFRLYEALEAGCVPIVEEGCPAGVEGYWRMLLGEEPPFPIVKDWSELVGLLPEMVAEWPANGNRAWAWWQRYKRRLALDLLDDVGDLGGGRPAEEVVTVLMPTSPIPSHPSTEVVEETLASIEERLPGVEVMMMIDGVRPEQEERREQYELYQRRLLWLANHEWPRVVPLRFDDHRHQVSMTKRALADVRTPLVLFVEHDTPLFGGDVDWRGLFRALLSGTANMIRLHHEANVLAPHEHLMIDREPVLIGGVPLLRTAQWSQRPHLARTDFYRRTLDAHFGPQARTMIEDVMHGAVIDRWMANGITGWEEFRLWMYAPPGDMKRSTHLDGRAGDPKYDMVFDRPEPT